MSPHAHSRELLKLAATHLSGSVAVALATPSYNHLPTAGFVPVVIALMGTMVCLIVSLIAYGAAESWLEHGGSLSWAKPPRPSLERMTLRGIGSALLACVVGAGWIAVSWPTWAILPGVLQLGVGGVQWAYCWNLRDRIHYPSEGLPPHNAC
jgi:hypothetical protein